jgi:hypothetical protein
MKLAYLVTFLYLTQAIHFKRHPMSVNEPGDNGMVDWSTSCWIITTRLLLQHGNRESCYTINISMPRMVQLSCTLAVSGLAMGLDRRSLPWPWLKGTMESYLLWNIDSMVSLNPPDKVLRHKPSFIRKVAPISLLRLRSLVSTVFVLHCHGTYK